MQTAHGPCGVRRLAASSARLVARGRTESTGSRRPKVSIAGEEARRGNKSWHAVRGGGERMARAKEALSSARRDDDRVPGRERRVVDHADVLDAVLELGFGGHEGSGIQSSLYDLFNPEKGHRVPTHVFMRADQAPDVPIKKKRRVIAS